MLMPRSCHQGENAVDDKETGAISYREVTWSR